MGAIRARPVGGVTVTELQAVRAFHEYVTVMPFCVADSVKGSTVGFCSRMSCAIPASTMAIQLVVGTEMPTAE